MVGQNWDLEGYVCLISSERWVQNVRINILILKVIVPRLATVLKYLGWDEHLGNE